MVRIYLIGFMACGKSYLSKRVAERMGLALIDLDRYIEEKNFMTVPELFSTFGEEEFRQREKKALHDVALIEDVVIATGGGAPCFFDNMETMNATGVTIYLQTPEEVIVDRLLNSKHKRPLVDGKSEAELLHYVHFKIKEREEFYLKAKAVINPVDMTLDEVVRVIENFV